MFRQPQFTLMCMGLAAFGCAGEVWDVGEQSRQELVQACVVECHQGLQQILAEEGDTVGLAEAYETCVAESCGTSGAEILELLGTEELTADRPELGAALARAWLSLPEARSHEDIGVSLEELRVRYPELVSDLDQAMVTGELRLSVPGQEQMGLCADEVGRTGELAVDLSDPEALELYQDLLVSKRLVFEISNFAVALEDAVATGRPAKHRCSGRSYGRVSRSYCRGGRGYHSGGRSGYRRGDHRSYDGRGYWSSWRRDGEYRDDDEPASSSDDDEEAARAAIRELFRLYAAAEDE